MKGRPRDLKQTPSLSRAWNRRVRKALAAKERQQARKACTNLNDKEYK